MFASASRNVPMTIPAMTPIQVAVAFKAVRHRADSQIPIAAENSVSPAAVRSNRSAEHLGPQQVAARPREHEQVHERVLLPLAGDARGGRQPDRAKETAEGQPTG